MQAGRVSLDDPLSAYLPDYPNEAMAAATIHQLLIRRELETSSGRMKSSSSTPIART
ncbi:hypothetical protein [Neoaquamicrobium sediminum]|uniref:hypothetical protein n=1 Tax=Neoaquamicrobium sediminum TaxID=1849104 RepID=UPI0035E3F77F